jgi:diguanylate cyclase (GGDEF)-like protein/PAS domain S-box-containing protein
MKAALRAYLSSYIGRMLLGTLLIHLVLTPVLFTSIFLLVAQDYKAQFINSIRAQSFQLAMQIGENQEPAKVQRVLDDLVLSGQTLFAEYEKDKRHIQAAPSMSNAEFNEDFYFGEHNDNIYFVAANIAEKNGHAHGILKLGFDELPLAQRIQTSYMRGIYIAAGYLVLTLILVGFFGRFLTQSIRQLREASHKIASGDTTTELTVKTHVTEVSNLALDLETMRMELVRREQEIALREATQRAVLENAAEGILTVDAQCCVKSFNKAAELIFGHREQEVLGKPFTQMLANSDVCLFNPEEETGLLIRQELIGLRKPDQEFDLLLSVSKTYVAGMHLFTILAQDISERKTFEAQLRYLATHDTLTRLPNRALFQDRLAQALAHAKRNACITALLFLDLDRFKNINDTLGHDFGDTLLIAVTERLRTCVRLEDTLARLGGDEFTVILPEVKHANDAAIVAQKILNALTRSFHFGERELFITASIGIALYPFDGMSSGDLAKHADSTMYVAKKLGGNNFQYFTSKINSNIAARMEMEVDLRHALARNELVLYYQPQIDIVSDRITGFEALLRWQRPGYGLVSPLQFIPLAEKTGLILPIGNWVLRVACAQLLAWQALDVGPLSIAVNLSARQFEQTDFLKTIHDTVTEIGLEPSSLEVELTESTVMHHVEQAIHVLEGLKKLGVRISIDDFGTGYSSLSYLKRFPIDILKIDKSFIADITTADDDGAIASAIIEMGHKLKLQLIAEGVENSEQLAFLRARKCTIVQGNYFSKPMPAMVITKMVETQMHRAGQPASSLT